VEVADSDLIGQGAITVVCHNERSGESSTIALSATPTPGLFRGSLFLVRTNQPAGAARLRVADGDTITAEYNDSSTSSKILASAEVDLSPPGISNIVATPDYENGIITWDTDEPTDALVQFGESTFLGKTAYDQNFSESHELLLTALVPDRTYYYQVVSRDPAGNTLIDDNNGKLYTFRTLKPLDAPWSDNLEGDTSGWSVQDADESEGTWEFGVVPTTNLLTSEAHSPTHAWGINLSGSSNGGLVESFLISPAIELSGGNVATLKFWHNYDFTADSIMETGELMLFTNTQTQPIILAQYGDLTAGWEQEEFDLSPHIGKVVQFIWHYTLFDFEQTEQHPGWLLDDVEVSVTNILRGTIQVTNNLALASFTISGPTPVTGSGKTYKNPVAQAGDYVITWNPVQYYTTPAPRTNTLIANGQILFTGTYTFTDVNTNGIPDEWEQHYFREVSPSRTKSIDTDGDGATDYAEFVAGTDPTSSSSSLIVEDVQILPNNRAHVTWSSAAQKTYVLMSSTDGVNWQKYTGELRASSDQTGYDIVLPSTSPFLFFKVQVMP